MSWEKWNEEHKGQKSAPSGSHPSVQPDHLSRSGAPHTIVQGGGSVSPADAVDTAKSILSLQLGDKAVSVGSAGFKVKGTTADVKERIKGAGFKFLSKSVTGGGIRGGTTVVEYTHPQLQGIRLQRRTDFTATGHERREHQIDIHKG